MKKIFLITVVSALTLLASISSVFACNFWAYEPEMPKSLQK